MNIHRKNGKKIANWLISRNGKREKGHYSRDKKDAVEKNHFIQLTPSSATPNGRATQMACEWKGKTVVRDDA